MKPSKKKDELAPTAKQELVEIDINNSMEVPEHLHSHSGPRLGSENVRTQDVIIPSLKLCQVTSDEGKPKNPKYIQGLQHGEYFNSVTKEIYGESLVVIPIHYYVTRVRWNAKEMGSGMRCSSSNGLIGIGDPGGDCRTCKQAARGYDEADTDRKCNEGMNFPLFVVKKGEEFNLSSIVIYQMKSIGCDTAKEWNSLDRIRNKNRFDGTYILGVREDHRDSGDSFQPTIKNLGWATPKQSAIGKLAYEAIVEWRKENRMHSSDDVERQPGEDEI